MALIVESTSENVNFKRFDKGYSISVLVDSTINAIGNKSYTAKLALNNSFICINGAGPNVSVFVIGADGKALFEYKTDPDGTITFSIAELQGGIYIIKSENITCKILKK